MKLFSLLCLLFTGVLFFGCTESSTQSNNADARIAWVVSVRVRALNATDVYENGAFIHTKVAVAEIAPYYAIYLPNRCVVTNEYGVNSSSHCPRVVNLDNLCAAYWHPFSSNAELSSDRYKIFSKRPSDIGKSFNGSWASSPLNVYDCDEYPADAFLSFSG